MVTVLEKNEPRTLDPQAGGMGPVVSVVVPVRNEEAFIEKTLLQLLSQDFPANGYEIIVADGRSTDTTREVVARLAERHSNLILVDNPGLWSSRGRNRA
ncbi:MAG: glycosyltransferase, partial [Gemmataceae bacterium]